MGQLITPEYVEMNKAMHAVGNYGLRGSRRAQDVFNLAMECGAKTILDYGCGQGTLRKSLTLPVREYDPAIPGKDTLPLPADLVVCTDVLEHVEPDCLDAVLAHLKSLTKKVCYVVVHLTPAKKVLPDGRNAHLIQQDHLWWRDRLSEYFEVPFIEAAEGGPPEARGREAAYVLTPKQR